MKTIIMINMIIVADFIIILFVITTVIISAISTIVMFIIITIVIAVISVIVITITSNIRILEVFSLLQELLELGISELLEQKLMRLL